MNAKAVWAASVAALVLALAPSPVRAAPPDTPAVGTAAAAPAATGTQKGAPPEAAPAAKEDGPPRESDFSRDRSLHGHFFLPSDFVPDPFVSTHFESLTAFGWLKAKTRNRPDGDITANLAQISQRVELQAALFRIADVPWLAVRLLAQGVALSPLDTEGFLVSNPSLGFNFGGGLAARLWGNDWVQFGVKADVGWAKSWALTPQTAIQNSLDRGALTLDGLLTPTSEVVFRPSFQFAFSPYKAVGLRSGLGYFLSDPSSGKRTHTLQFGVGLDADLNPVSPVPLGLDLTYSLDRDFTNELLVHYFGGGLFYTGRRNLSLGLEARVAKLSQSDQGVTVTFLTVEGGFRVRYYW